MTLVLFGAFVVWNGGVVLGDKSNHIATVHLAQMLYIWPFFMFFSAPLLLPYATLPVSWLQILLVYLFRKRSAISQPGEANERDTPRVMSSQSSQKRSRSEERPHKNTESQAGAGSEEAWKSPALARAIWFFDNKIYYIPLILTSLAASLLIVKFNTIIHPFTLADNRHYMFYVFRYTIRRPGFFRYYLVLPYAICQWLSWDTLAGCGESNFSVWTPECSGFYHGGRDPPYVSYPLWTPRAHRRRQTNAPKMPVGALAAVQVRGEQGVVQTWLDDPTSTATEPVTTSTVALFFVATALSLITAPLVEPRYFILPWVFWRLLVPAWRTHEHVVHQARYRFDHVPGLDFVLNIGKRHDIRLVLETLWFMVVNAVTMYIFLAKPYQWRAEDGTALDGGRLQRFMW
jgi:alpha-1,2-glucosyltransferase